MAVETGGCEDDEKMKYTVSRICMLFLCIYRVYCKFVFASLHQEREREREALLLPSLNVRIYGYDVHRYESVSSVYVCSVCARARLLANMNVCVSVCMCMYMCM